MTKTKKPRSVPTPGPWVLSRKFPRPRGKDRASNLADGEPTGSLQNHDRPSRIPREFLLITWPRSLNVPTGAPWLCLHRCIQHGATTGDLGFCPGARRIVRVVARISFTVDKSAIEPTRNVQES